jgi:hypothetical protein
MSNEHRMGNQPPLNVPVETLAAEVEHLRAEVNGLLHVNENQRSNVKEANAAYRRLLAENAELRRPEKCDICREPSADILVCRLCNEDWDRVASQTEALKKENAELRTAYEYGEGSQAIIDELGGRCLDKDKTIAKLEAENAELLKLKEDWARVEAKCDKASKHADACFAENEKFSTENDKLKARLAEVEKETAELRGQLTEELTSKFAETFGQFDVPALKAKLAWFEKRETEFEGPGWKLIPEVELQTLLAVVKWIDDYQVHVPDLPVLNAALAVLRDYPRPAEGTPVAELRGRTADGASIDDAGFAGARVDPGEAATLDFDVTDPEPQPSEGT